jgi:hypothetical protein
MEWIAYPVPLKEGSRAPGWAIDDEAISQQKIRKTIFFISQGLSVIKNRNSLFSKLHHISGIKINHTATDSKEKL